MRSVKTILVMMALLIGGCSREMVMDHGAEQAIRIATLKYAMSPEWTHEDYKKEIRYQEYLQRKNDL